MWHLWLSRTFHTLAFQLRGNNTDIQTLQALGQQPCFICWHNLQNVALENIYKITLSVYHVYPVTELYKTRLGEITHRWKRWFSFHYPLKNWAVRKIKWNTSIISGLQLQFSGTNRRGTLPSSIVHMYIFTYNSFWSWIRIIELIRTWFFPASSPPIYSVTACTIPITWELVIPI